MLKLCCNYRLVILTVNYTNENIYKLEDFSNQKSDLSKLHQAMGTGKHWYYVPHLRLFVAETDKNDEFNNKRFLQIWHSKFLKAKTGCFVQITDAGVV